MTKTRRRTGDPAVYEAMEFVIQRGLGEDDSAFTPGTAVWTAENFAALRQHFIEQPDLGKDSYLEKLEGQLRGAGVIQLMAELHYIHFLLPSTVTGRKKLEIITAILAVMESPSNVPEALHGALGHGFINPGTFYLTRRDAQLSFLIEFGQAWKGLSTAEQDEHLADPWSFKRFLFELPIHSAYAQREGLLHLIHTEAFEAIVSREHKQLIAKRFSSLLDDPDPDVDRQLEAIRAALTPTYGAEFDFYDERVRPQWRGWRYRGMGPVRQVGTEVLRRADVRCRRAQLQVQGGRAARGGERSAQCGGRMAHRPSKGIPQLVKQPHRLPVTQSFPGLDHLAT